ncbi:MAG: hypothetical protein FWF15_12380 [Oscillospiraceae bacterium]|nr:hypothetical protein [Oscillospiraceae bacterium]
MMNLGELIVAAMEPVGLHIEPGTFTENYDTYLVYNYDEIPVMFADNEPQFIRYLVQIHLIAPPGKYTYAYRKKIWKCLIENDFTHPEIIQAHESSKLGGGEQHFVYMTEYTASTTGEEGVDIYA